MKQFGLLSAVLVFLSASALADDTKITTRAEAIKVMGEVSASIDKQNDTFTRYADAAQKIAALYSSLDAQATKLSKAPSCAHDPAVKDMQSAQASLDAQYLQLQAQLQAESKSFAAQSNILKTKHDTVKNSISNIR